MSSLGETSKHAIYFHLEKSFNIKRLEIPYKIDDFTDAMEKIFGMGASFLEILIMKRLHQKVGRAIQLDQSKDFTFIEYVAATKRSFLKKKRAQEIAKPKQIMVES